MAATLQELDALLNDLQTKLPQMVADYTADGDFWMAFAGAAEAIEDRAGEHTYEHVMRRINDMLAEHGRFLVGVEATP